MTDRLDRGSFLIGMEVGAGSKTGRGFQAYSLRTCIVESNGTRIFRGDRNADGRPVIVKQLRSLYPATEALAGLAREFEVTRAAAGPGVIEAVELIKDDRIAGIAFEDFGGESVALMLAAEKMSVQIALRIALQTAHALASIHRRSIVHRDISPANIVWNGATGIAKLIDFGIAQVLRREAISVRSSVGTTHFAGTPAYMSPEQTGRMNRGVDSRSDLYSLGATLYRMLSGRDPFDSGDPLALTHAHLAKTPTALHILDRNIPRPVSEIVMTLLKKRAEDRFQSASGVAYDLEACLADHGPDNSTRRFVLGSQDRSERLTIPEKLYGRETEVERLLDAFTLAADGAARVLHVHGYSGIGKTSLVHEAYAAMADRSARVVEGKCDQFNRSTPYAALIHALNELVASILAESTEVQTKWRTSILQSVGDNGRVLVDMLPDIEILLGPQPLVAEVPPAEARNRLRLVLASFVRAAATMHPLVVFLDDLQWADLPTIDLLATFAKDPDSRHVLLVGAYRDNEITEIHPLSLSIADLTASGARIDFIELGPLGEDHALQLVSDTLGDSDNRAPLALLCHGKTGGNAFFFKRFLNGLYDDGLLIFEPSARRWTWNLDDIQKRSITENVVEYLTHEIERLSPQARRAVEMAACIGDVFDLKTCAAALGSTRHAALEGLAEALRVELIEPSERGFWFATAVDEATTNFKYRFVHDRVRQAAHSMLSVDEAKRIHLGLGRAISDQLGDPATDPRLFEVVEHLNHAGELIHTSAELEMRCDLNMAAGRRAAHAAAFPAAHGFFQHSLQNALAMGGDPWEASYARTLAIHVEGARMAYLCGEQPAMEQLVAAAIGRAHNVIDRVAAQEVRIYALVAASQFSDAVATALDALATLGVTLPEEPTASDVENAVGSTLSAFQERSPDEIIGMQRLTDPTLVAAQRIQSLAMSSAYLARPMLLPLLAASIVRSTLSHGISNESPYGFAAFAIVLNAINMIDVSFAAGTIGYRMLDRVDDRSVRPRTMHVYFNLVKPFIEPVREMATDQQRTVQMAIDTGDIEYASWALHAIAHGPVYAGTPPLADAAESLAQSLAVFEHNRQLPQNACTTPFGQVIRNLRGEADDPSRLVGEGFDGEAMRAEMIAINFRGAAFILTVLGAYVRFIFGKAAEAEAYADSGAAYADGAVSTYHQVWFRQFRVLSILQQMRVGSKADLSGIEDDVQQLRVWDSFSPVNHAHRVLLVDAEIARVEGRLGDAADLYDRAIAAAGAEFFQNDQALSNELCGAFHLERGSETAARGYLLEACHGYARWGAVGKSAHLAARHAALLGGQLLPSAARESAGGGHNTGGRTGHSQSLPASAELDLATIFKAANLLAGESNLDALLGRVLDVAIENAGATRGFLLIEEGDGLVTGAARNAHGDDIMPSGGAVRECGDLVAGVVNFVERRRRAVVLADVRADSRWSRLDGVDQGRPCSILCAPLVHQHAMTCIVYLENELIADAFSPERVRVLELLLHHAAISIENARATEELRAHRDDLEKLVNERTRELDRALAELKAANVILDELSLTDALTGLANRRAFDRTLADEWERSVRDGTSLGILMIDVDYFKSYNDHYGHQQGDDCLRQIAQAISAQLTRSTDTLARYGGEEFAAILPGVDAQAVRQLAGEMIAVVREIALPHAVSTAGDCVTISIGAAFATHPFTDPGALLQTADGLLYRAKDLGRNRLEMEAP